jgi:hypothetical protein
MKRMNVAATHTPSAGAQAALDALAADLRRIFGDRLQSIVAYDANGAAEDDEAHSLALVERVTFEDLTACAPLVTNWRRRGLAVPLILSSDEFRRTVDVFPLEYGDIIHRHALIYGRNPFAGVEVSPADLRRACELQAKSHVIHLREGFLETDGRGPGVARLIAASAPAFRALLDNIGRLSDPGSGDNDEHGDEAVAARAERQIGVPAAVVREVLASPRGGASAIVDPTALFSRYLAATERIWQYVDAWRR